MKLRLNEVNSSSMARSRCTRMISPLQIARKLRRWSVSVKSPSARGSCRTTTWPTGLRPTRVRIIASPSLRITMAGSTLDKSENLFQPGRSPVARRPTETAQRMRSDGDKSWFPSRLSRNIRPTSSCRPNRRARNLRARRLEGMSVTPVSPSLCFSIEGLISDVAICRSTLSRSSAFRHKIFYKSNAFRFKRLPPATRCGT